MTSRVLVPEILDELPASDAAAQHSRADLRRLNALMGHARLIARELQKTSPLKRVADLGGGDGTLMLNVARRLRARDVELAIVDRQNSMRSDAAPRFSELGWNMSLSQGDVFEVVRRSEQFDAITANLFLHHFADEQLRELLAAIAERTSVFIACEPRRSTLALLASRSVGLIGCNHVTRHDAVVSVRAGFHDSELSALWVARGWRFGERAAGLFSHLFVARRA
jgi:2-polyprenyl-3-methyl-5-hydroxy-6-metoxy-1,4-benzoquinol methylase